MNLLKKRRVFSGFRAFTDVLPVQMYAFSIQ